MTSLWILTTVGFPRPAMACLVISATCFCLMLLPVFYRATDLPYEIKPWNWTTKASPRAQTPAMAAKTQILLVASGRSGSTFTSALINQHDDVFFVFEPLYVLKRSNPGYNKEGDSLAIIKAFLNCDFPPGYVFALGNSMHRNSDSTRNFYQCFTATETPGTSHVACFLQLMESCRRHRVTLVKSIRFNLQWAESLLADNPHFKLLYLVRDPRATLFSQARVFRSFEWNTSISNASTIHCSQLALDLQAAERFRRLYPKQIKCIRYEQGATDVLSYTKDIYNFLEMPVSGNLVEYIRNITTAPEDSPEVHDPYSIYRHNTTQTMNKWRLKAGFNNVREVDKACQHLYPKLGYRPVVSQQHLESGESLVIPPVVGDIFT